MKKIVYDCDLTLGVPGCDVDDGLALMYLLGCPEAELLGVTATYGNNKIDVVWETMNRMLSELGQTELPARKGGAARGEFQSDAAEFLVDMANQYAGELSILATGSLTNLGGAYTLDPHFFEKVKEIVLMGGITEPLVFEKKIMDELNFSCDPEATAAVLTKGKNVSIITGNNCLKVLFTKEEYTKRLLGTENPAAIYIREKTDYWFGYNEEDYGIGGFYNWDVTAAVYLMHKELFAHRKNKFKITEEDLQTGNLRMQTPGNCTLNLPEIKEEKSFKDEIYRSWMHAGERCFPITEIYK